MLLKTRSKRGPRNARTLLKAFVLLSSLLMHIDPIAAEARLNAKATATVRRRHERDAREELKSVPKFCAFRPPTPSTVIDVTIAGASNRGDSDTKKVLQGIINRAPAGSRLVFPKGVYLISGALSLRSNLSYEGDLGKSRIVLTAAAASPKFIFLATQTNPANIAIRGLYLVGGGIGFGFSFRNLDVRCNVFEAMNGTPGNGYDNNGIQTNLGGTNATIIGNKFMNANLSGGWNNWGNLVNIRFERNYCYNIRECFHTYGMTGRDVSLSYNTVIGISRMGFEVQTAIRKLVIRGNYLAQWRSVGQPTNPSCAASQGFECDSFAFSIAMTPNVRTSSYVIDNLVLGTPGVSWGIEQSSDFGIVTGNLLQDFNYWIINEFQRGPLVVRNNRMCGGAAWNSNKRWQRQNATYEDCKAASWVNTVPPLPHPPF